MNWLNQIGGILQQYSGAAAAQAPDTVENDFEQVAQTAPPATIADALAAAFRSDQTPAFGQMASQMFGNSNGQQKAGMLNILIATVGPAVLSQLMSGRSSSVLGRLLSSGNREITPDQAEQVSPDEVQQIAAEAEKKDPSIIDRFSNFYAEHPTLIKTLGGAALTIALAKIAERHSGM